LAKRSSPDSADEVRASELIEFIEFMAANPLGPLFCCTSCRDSGGCSATGLKFSGPEGFRLELGVGVGLVTGVGIELGPRLATFLNELKDETATSGDCGERRCAEFGPESGDVSEPDEDFETADNSLSFADKSFSLVCSFNPFSLSVNFRPLTGDTGVAGPVGYMEFVVEDSRLLATLSAVCAETPKFVSIHSFSCTAI
jgi:hypothetical protein